MDDTISRKQAIDALKELTANGTNKGMVFGEDAVHRIEMLPPAQPAQHIDADGTLWITVSDIERVNRVIVDEEKSKFCRQFYMDAKPEPCEDAVSRQAAIRACGGYLVPAEIIKALPPVTPKQIDSMTNEQIAKSVANDLSKWLADENDTRSSYAVIYSALILAAQREGDAE